MDQQPATSVQSHEEVTQLAVGHVLLEATYSFMNPYSINGPFGTLQLTITAPPPSSNPGPTVAFGTVTIQTIFGLGSTTKLQYNGTSSFNGSTGYTTVTAQGVGTMNSFPDHAKPVQAAIQLAIQPGYKSGTITVEGFLSGFTLTATSLQIGDTAP
jgi:hypothetical protein